MSKKISSAFDDLLADNTEAFDQLMGSGRSSILPPRPAPPVRKPSLASEEEASPSAGTVHEGTANGIPFRLTTD